MTSRRFALLDRDGTIIEKIPYLTDPQKVALLPGAGEALRLLRSLGFGLLLVTNQSAVGRGLLTMDGLAEIHARLNDLLTGEGVELDGIYVCPHLPEADCACRKPKTGLVDQAARDWGFAYKSCLVIGDNKCDVDLGRVIGAQTILVRTGEGSRVAEELLPGEIWVEQDLLAAARSLAQEMQGMARGKL